MTPREYRDRASRCFKDAEHAGVGTEQRESWLRLGREWLRLAEVAEAKNQHGANPRAGHALHSLAG